MTGLLQRQFGLPAGGGVYDFGTLRDDGDGNQRDSDNHRRRDAFRVSAYEFRELIAGSVQARYDGTALQIAPDVFRELLDRKIAAVRFLAQRHEDDVVEIAGQFLAQA